MECRLERCLRELDYRLVGQGDLLFIYVNPGSLEKKDWRWLRDKHLKKVGFRHVGGGQSDWFFLWEVPNA